jgi:hypothetical protein
MIDDPHCVEILRRIRDDYRGSKPGTQSQKTSREEAVKKLEKYSSALPGFNNLHGQKSAFPNFFTASCPQVFQA